MTWLHDFLANQSNAQTRDGMEIYPPIRSGPQNAIRATSPASPYARDRIEAPSNRPAPRTPTLRSRTQDVVRSAPGALTTARERFNYDLSPAVSRGARDAINSLPDTDWARVGQELTGLPSLARGAGGLTGLARRGMAGGFESADLWRSAGPVAETALGLAGPMSLPRGAARVSRSVPLTQQYDSADTFESGPFSALYFNASPNRVNLLEMGTDSSARGQGHARRGMQEFLRSHGNRDIYLTPSPTEPPYDVARLEGFYRSLGFEPVPGDADMFAWRRLGANPAETAQRIPNVAREIGPNGMPIAQPQPYRNSLRGGSGDLREAAGMGAPSVASESYPISLLWEGDNIGYNGPWSAWDVTQRPVSSLDIRLAQITGAREVRPHSAAPNTDWTPQDHARRIATLMRERPADPITIRRIGDNEPMRNADGSVDYAPQVIDGKHRLAAARMRGDRNINVQWEQPRTPPPTTPTGTAPFGDPRAYPPQAWEEFGSLQGGTPEARARVPDGGNGGVAQRVPRRIMDVRTPRGETHETIVNPTEADILRLTQPGRVAAPGLAIDRGVPISSSRGVRYIKDADGNVYVGNSYDVTHHDLVTHYGLPNRGSLDGGEIVRLPDGTLELQNNDGAMPLPRGWLSGRAQAGNPPQPLLGGTPEARLRALTGLAPMPIAAHALTQQQNTTGRPRGRPGFFGGR